MRNSIIARLAITLTVVSLVLFSGSAAYATWGGWSWGGWSNTSDSSSYSKSDKSDKSGKWGKSDKSGKSGKSDKSDKSDKSKKSGKWGKSDKSDKSKKSGKWGKSDKSDKSGKSGKSGKGPGYPDHPVDPVIEGNCAVYYAGQHTVAGSVCLTIIGDTVFVDYIMEGGWTLSNPHLWIGDTLASAPTTHKGSPIPGQFPFNADVNGVDMYTFEIPVSDLNVNADLLCTEDYALLVAAHGEVANGGQQESAWAGETRFTKKGSWATYFGVVPECEDPDPEPEPQVCELAEVSADFSSAVVPDSATIELTSGVFTTFAVTAPSGRTGSLIAPSVTITDNSLLSTLTYVNISILRTGVDDQIVGEYFADEPAPGEFKQGVTTYQPTSVATPDGEFTLRTQIELCEIGPQDPGPSA